MKKFYILMVALLIVSGAMAQWVQQNSGTTSWLNSVFFTDANTGYVVGGDQYYSPQGIILKTTEKVLCFIDCAAYDKRYNGTVLPARGHHIFHPIPD
jgi:hypothetical protein